MSNMCGIQDCTGLLCHKGMMIRELVRVQSCALQGTQCVHRDNLLPQIHIMNNSAYKKSVALPRIRILHRRKMEVWDQASVLSHLRGVYHHLGSTVLYDLSAPDSACVSDSGESESVYPKITKQLLHVTDQ